MEWQTISQQMKLAGSWALDMLYPPRCPACHQPVEAHGTVCRECFAKLHVISEPHCACCGVPFTMDMGEGALCASCIAHPPVFSTARSVWVYNPVAAQMIKTLKLEDQPAQLASFAAQLKRIAQPLMQHEPVIMPVPMYWQHLMARRYNPPSWLAYKLAEITGRDCDTASLVRVRGGSHQRGLSRTQRLKNLRRAFEVKPSARAKLKGKAILLVDDVITTGATANACASVLKQAGAARVDVITLAHVLLEGA